MGRFNIPFGDEFGSDDLNEDNEPSELGKLPKEKNVVRSWGISGKLVTLNSSAGVHLNCQFEDVANYTLQFYLLASRVTPANAGGRPVIAAGFRAKANVVWSVKGQPIRRQFHVGDGTSLVGTADGVDVTLIDDSQVSSTYGGIEYDAFVTVTKGTRGSHKQPVFYDLGVQPATPGGSSGLSIPDDIGAISIFVAAISNDPANPVTNGATAVTVDNGIGPVLVFDPFRNTDWTPLPPDAVNIVYAQTALGGADVLFSTFIGIDG